MEFTLRWERGRRPQWSTALTPHPLPLSMQRGRSS